MILLIGITAAVATLAGIVLLDIGEDGLTQTAQAGVEVNETPNGVELKWNTDSNAEQILVQANGKEYQLNSVNDSLTLGLPEDTGGLIGYNNGLSISKSYATGDQQHRWTYWICYRWKRIEFICNGEYYE